MYRIDPCSSNPRFILEGQLKINELEHVVGLTQEDRIFFCDKNGDKVRFFAVWDWVRGTGCKWPVKDFHFRRDKVS